MWQAASGREIKALREGQTRTIQRAPGMLIVQWEIHVTMAMGGANAQAGGARKGLLEEVTPS